MRSAAVTPQRVAFASYIGVGLDAEPVRNECRSCGSRVRWREGQRCRGCRGSKAAERKLVRAAKVLGIHVSAARTLQGLGKLNPLLMRSADLRLRRGS